MRSFDVKSSIQMIHSLPIRAESFVRLDTRKFVRRAQFDRGPCSRQSATCRSRSSVDERDIRSRSHTGHSVRTLVDAFRPDSFEDEAGELAVLVNGERRIIRDRNGRFTSEEGVDPDSVTMSYSSTHQSQTRTKYPLSSSNISGLEGSVTCTFSGNCAL